MSGDIELDGEPGYCPMCGKYLDEVLPECPAPHYRDYLQEIEVLKAENAKLRDLLRFGRRLWSDEPPANLYPKVREWERKVEAALRGEKGGA